MTILMKCNTEMPMNKKLTKMSPKIVCLPVLVGEQMNVASLKFYTASTGNIPSFSSNLA